MARTIPYQLASATARDGVDTRNKDNSTATEVALGETTCLGAGDQIRGGQTAALYDYMIPPIHAVDRFDTWARYKRNADLYAELKSEYGYYSDIKVGEDVYIAKCCAAISPSEMFLNIHREFYNDAVTDLRRTIAKAEQNMEKYRDDENCQYELQNIKRANELCAYYLSQYNNELEKQNNAAKLIQQAYRAFKAPKVQISETGTLIAEDDHEEDYGKCVKCDEPRMGDWVELCAYCYWDEDAEIKHQHRAARQNAIPPGGYTIQVNTVLVPGPLDVGISDTGTCQGCRDNQPNQLAHMDSGGCLEEPFLPCSNVNCESNAYNSIYFGYCSSECRYS